MPKVWLPWFTFTTAGMDWRVILTDAETLKERGGCECEALCLPDDLTILIDHTYPESKRRVCLIHEMLHACTAGVGSKEVLKHLFNSDTKLEERIITYVAPLLSDAFAGRLRLPRAPKDT